MLIFIYFIQIHLGQGALSCHHQELEYTVRRSRVREIRFYDWIEQLQLIAVYLAAHHTLSRLHEVHIAAQGINFAVVSKQAMNEYRALFRCYLWLVFPAQIMIKLYRWNERLHLKFARAGLNFAMLSTKQTWITDLWYVEKKICGKMEQRKSCYNETVSKR